MIEILPELKDVSSETRPSRNRVSEIITPSKSLIVSDNTVRDKFDYKKYQRRPQDYLKALGSKKIVANIPVKRPEKTSWVRVHPEIEVSVGVFEERTNREFFLIDPDIYDDLGKHLSWAVLFLTKTSQGDLFFWPVKSNGTGQSNRWAESALTAVKKGKERWIRVEANLAAGGYDVFVPAADPPDVEWGQVDINHLLEEAFRGRIIDDPDHPIILNLQGRFSC